MKKIIRLTESDLKRVIKKILNEGYYGDNKNFRKAYSHIIYDGRSDYLGEIGPYNDEDSIVSDIEHDGSVTRQQIMDTEQFKKFAVENNISPEEKNFRFKRIRNYMVDNRMLQQRYYPISESYELYDEKTDTWYNEFGQQLRDPSEYSRDEPFGDEGYDY